GSLFPIDLSVSEVNVDGRRVFAGVIHDTTRRKQTQEEKDRLLQHLNKRNIEITCLYKVNESIRSKESLSEIFQDVVHLVGRACLYPYISRCRVTFDTDIFVDEPFEESP